MKKILGVLLLMFPLSIIQAAGGKNLLNPQNFVLSQNVLASVENVSVNPSTFYTLSMPDFSMLDLVDVYVIGETGTIYIDETLGTYDICETAPYAVVCTFETIVNETGLEISFSNGFIGQWYAYYEMFDFQLELGTSKTPFENYIPGENSSHPVTPIVQGAGSIEVNYARNKSLQSIIDQYITVIDNMDGDITDSIVIETDEYTGNEAILGTYTVLLSAEDKAGNKATFELIITVIDSVPPVITGPSSLSVQIDQKVPIDDIVTSKFSFNDAYSGVITTYEIIEDEYTDATTLGDYRVRLKIEDLSGNVTTREFVISLVSLMPPNLEGPDTITLYLSEDPNDLSITQLFTASDRADQTPLAVTIKSSNIDHYAIAGRYTVTLETKDPLNNISSKTVTVVLVDDIPPIFSYDETIIVPLGTEMDELDLYRFLEDYYKNQGIDISHVTFLENQYNDFKHQEGTYPYAVEIVSNTGETFLHEGLIRVEEVTYEQPFDNHLLWISGFVFLGMVGLAIKKR
jgi:hypothetical protein